MAFDPRSLAGVRWNPNTASYLRDSTVVDSPYLPTGGGGGGGSRGQWVYGDSYGGVQGAEQAADNSDRNFIIAQIAAQQRAQQQAETVRQFNETRAFQRDQLDAQDQLKRYGIDSSYDLGLEKARMSAGNADVGADARIQAAQIAANARRAAGIPDGVDPDITSNFANELKALQSRRSTLESDLDQWTGLSHQVHTNANQDENSGLVEWDKGQGAYKPKDKSVDVTGGFTQSAMLAAKKARQYNTDSFRASEATLKIQQALRELEAQTKAMSDSYAKLGYRGASGGQIMFDGRPAGPMPRASMPASGPIRTAIRPPAVTNQGPSLSGYVQKYFPAQDDGQVGNLLTSEMVPRY
jgi:hypothetical protein